MTNRTMLRLGQNILALLIAISVAMLPIAGSAIAKPMGPVGVMENVGPVDSDMMVMDDCCPDHPKPCAGDDMCQSMAACAFQSVALPSASISQLAYLAQRGTLLPVLTDRAVPLHAAGPPFRPPRI